MTAAIIASIFVVTEASGEYDPVAFTSEKRAQYWINAQLEEDDSFEFEITETTPDDLLDADELEAADNAEEVMSEEEENEELEDA